MIIILTKLTFYRYYDTIKLSVCDGQTVREGGILMKKYHIADVLTAARFLIAVVIFVLTLSLGAPNNWLIFWLFSVGELTDALDGEFARRFHYPMDGKKRFWREFNSIFWIYNYELFDIVADLALGLSALFYIVLWINAPLGLFVFGGAIGVGFFVQTIVSTDLRVLRDKRTRYEIRRRLIIRRRYWYVFALAIMFLTLLWTSEVHLVARFILTMILICVSIVIYSKKQNTRLKDDKTPL